MSRLNRFGSKCGPGTAEGANQLDLALEAFGRAGLSLETAIGGQVSIYYLRVQLDPTATVQTDLEVSQAGYHSIRGHSTKHSSDLVSLFVLLNSPPR